MFYILQKYIYMEREREKGERILREKILYRKFYQSQTI